MRKLFLALLLLNICINPVNANSIIQGKKLIETVLFVPASAITQSFQTNIGLLGYIVKPAHSMSHVVFVNLQANYLILGSVITGRGINLTQKATLNYIIHPNQKPQILVDAKCTAWFQQGSPTAPHQIYVLADPNCSACHDFYESILPYINKGQLSVRWILYPFLKPSSYAKAASILMAKNPTNAFEENEAVFDTVLEKGGIQPMSNIPYVIKQALKKNIKFAKHYKLFSTPISIYQVDSGELKVLKGSLSDEQLKPWIHTIESISKKKYK